jgi:hypothetical protein
MERERFQGYVASLEQTMKNTHFDLREGINQFRELCQWVTPERITPMGIITDIRQTYKEIQDQLTKIRGINQLLEAKYRQYYRRDSLRAREIMEFRFLAKNLYSKFEYTLHEIEAKRKLRDRGERLEAPHPRIPFPWFHSKENQIILLRNLRSLYGLDYKTRSDFGPGEKREVMQNRLRSVSLFVLSGEIPLIDNLQSRMQLREYDIKERFTREELRGALTHLREISLSEVERVIRRFMDSSESPKLKCLLFSIQSQKDLEKEIMGSTKNILHGMGGGEVRTLPIWKTSLR